MEIGDRGENKMLILQKEGARISLQMQRGRTASDRRQLARAAEVALESHCITLYYIVLLYIALYYAVLHMVLLLVELCCKAQS